MKLETIRDTIKDLTQIDIFEQTRRREVIEMRSVANRYLSKVKKMRLTEIMREYKRCGYDIHHATILYHLKNYEQICFYNPEIEIVFKALIGDPKLYVLGQIPKASDKQIEQIEEILLG